MLMRTFLFRCAPFLCTLLIIGWSPLASAMADDVWPQWRGPDGQGHADATNLPVNFDRERHTVWERELPGKGWSSPVVADGKIWMTTAVETEPTEEDLKRAKEASTGIPLAISGSVSMRAICVDWKTGELLHDIELMVEEEPQPIHTLNSYASPSPIIEAGRLYCYFGAHGTACLDVGTGQVLWTNHEIQIAHENGPGSTPVLWGDHLIVHCDGSDEQYVVAINKTTGKTAWKTARSGELHDNPQFKKSYGTPIVIELEGKPVLISPGADWLYAYNPNDGHELWKVGYGELGFSIVPRPVYGNGKIFMSTSFMQPRILAIDVTSEQPKIAWQVKKQAPTMPSPLLVENRLYFVSERGIMSCVDAATGEAKWSERLGGNFCSSPLFANGKIYVGNRNGVMFVLQPGDQFKLLARNQMDSGIMASPVALDRSLLIRTEDALVRLQQD